MPYSDAKRLLRLLRSFGYERARVFSYEDFIRVLIVRGHKYSRLITFSELAQVREPSKMLKAYDELDKQKLPLWL